jgi:hypothetical protein
MKTVVRGGIAFALLVGLVTTATSAEANGAAHAYLSIDVLVQGTPPPGATITLVHATGNPPVDEFPVTLAELGDGPEVGDFEVNDIFHAVFVDPEDDGGADAIDYSCETSGVDGSTPHIDTICAELAPNPPAPVVYAGTSFWGQNGDTTSERSDITVTLTYDPPPLCDGREVTVDLNDEDTPTAGVDVILGTSGNDTINGLGGADRVCGAGGKDTIRGGAGRDRILGGVGADRLEGGNDGDTLLGGAGVDTLLGQAGNDALNGGTQRDTCNGGPQQDTATACEVRSGIP